MVSLETFFDVGVDILLPEFSSSILASIESLQKEQTPPFSDGIYFIEMRKRLISKGGFIFSHVLPILLDPLFCCLFKTGAFYANTESTKYSIVKINEDYNTYREGIQKKFPGYDLDSENLVINKSDEDVDLFELKSFLLSRDINSYEKEKAKFFGKQVRFLKPHQDFYHVSYASYPRSGNTFLRKYLESITGLATGSDMVMKFTLNMQLQYSGFKGEGIVDNRCWINKTHFPFRIPYDKSYDTNAIICCVRNPLDVIVSCFHLIGTITHNRVIEQRFWEEFEEWNEFVINEILGIKRWHEHWIQAAKNMHVPIFFIRFEDLLANPLPNLRDVFRFLMAEPNIEGTCVDKRINEVLEGGSSCILYKLKKGGASVNKHLEKYTQDQYQRILNELEEVLHFFGYVKRGDNPYGFFDYQGKASKESVAHFEHFRVTNQIHMKWILGEKEKLASNMQYGINLQNSGFSMIKAKGVSKLGDLPTKTRIQDFQ